MKLDKKKVEAEFSSADAKTRATGHANLEGIVRLGVTDRSRTMTEAKLTEGGGGKRSTAQFDLRIAVCGRGESTSKRN